MTRGFTDVAIRAMKPGDVRREIPDFGASNLYLVIQPSGKKSFAVRYRYNGKSRKLKKLASASPPRGDSPATRSIKSSKAAIRRKRKKKHAPRSKPPRPTRYRPCVKATCGVKRASCARQNIADALSND